MRRFHELPAEEYAQLDIGEVNLECADKLYGSENLNVPEYVEVLDRWAELVSEKTRNLWYRFEQAPADYQNSAAYFRMLVMVTVLQRDLGVFYAVGTLEKEFDATDSRLHFLHGIIEGCGGTCSTMPVLYAAIGRRLGYPLRLVNAVEHLFVRWDDPVTGERFNIEATSRGLNVRSDEYYMTWPKPANPDHVAQGWLLKSMAPQEELAVFYHSRAACFLDWMNFRNAVELAHCASELAGGERNPYRHGLLAITTVLYLEDIGKAKYGFKRNGKGIVLQQDGKERPMESWERWGVLEAGKELKRIEKLHVARRQNKGTHLRNKRIVELADRPTAAVEAYFSQEAL